MTLPASANKIWGLAASVVGERRRKITGALATYRGKLITATVSLYLLATIVVAVLVWSGSDSRSYVARAAFPANHRIVVGDLAVQPDVEGTARELVLPDRAQLVGKYMSHDVAAGAPITARDLTPRPSVRAAAGMAIVAVPISSHFSEDVIDAGSPVDIAANGRLVARNGRVAAVPCAEQACVALVELPRSLAAAVTGMKGEATVVPTNAASGAIMDQKAWSPLTKNPLEVPAAPEGLWTRALEFVPPGTTLKLAARGTWTYGEAATKPPSPLKCGPDGSPDSTQTGLLMTDAPVGAVIAKIGGSTAGKTDGELFVVGSETVITADPQKRGGPLYLTMNVNPASRPATSDKVGVAIWEAKP
jgi:hypothetical protein